jgi:uncharacterized RDD family membrane protein YckC
MNEYVTQTDPTAVVGRRFGAFVVDSIVLFAIPAALFFATANIVLYESPTTCPQVENAGRLSSSEVCVDDLDFTIQDDAYTAATYKPAAGAIAGAVYLLYLVLVEWIVQGMTGATLGKAIFGIRTVDEQGQPPGLGKQFIRGLLWLPIVLFNCLVLVPMITILASKGHRRLGDMAAKTFVVHTSAKGSPVVVPGVETAGPTGPATPYTPAGGDQTLVAPGSPAAPPAPAGPQWDAARNAYVQWDPVGNRWLTYDDAAAQWKPIEGGQPPTPPS